MTYLRLQDMSDEDLINEYLQHYPRIFEDADAVDTAITQVIGELRNLGLPGELCSRISQLLRKLGRGDRGLPGYTGQPGDEEGCKQAPESRGVFQHNPVM